MTAKLFFDPDFGTVVVRDANEPVESHRENLLEITSEQAIALSLSFHRPMPEINCKVDAEKMTTDKVGCLSWRPDWSRLKS